MPYFIKLCINTAYFLCLCPFRLKQNQNEDSLSESATFVAVSWQPQKFATFLLTILNLFYTFIELKDSIPSKSKDPSKYFTAGSSLAGVTWICLIYKYVWFSQQNLVTLLNNLVKSRVSITDDFSSSSRQSLKNKLVGAVLVIVYVTEGICWCVVNDEIPTLDWQFLHFWDKMICCCSQYMRLRHFIGFGCGNYIFCCLFIVK